MQENFPHSDLERISAREFNQNLSAAKRAADNAPILITERGEVRYVLMSYRDFNQSLYDLNNNDDKGEGVESFKPEAIISRLEIIMDMLESYQANNHKGDLDIKILDDWKRNLIIETSNLHGEIARDFCQLLEQRLISLRQEMGDSMVLSFDDFINKIADLFFKKLSDLNESSRSIKNEVSELNNIIKSNVGKHPKKTLLEKLIYK